MKHSPRTESAVREAARICPWRKLRIGQQVHLEISDKRTRHRGCSDVQIRTSAGPYQSTSQTSHAAMGRILGQKVDEQFRLYVSAVPLLALFPGVCGGRPLAKGSQR